MKQILVWLAGTAIVVFTGCGLFSDSYQKVAKDFVAVLTKLNNTLDSVHSVKDAESAAAKIEKLAVRVDELTLRVKKLPPPDKQSGSLDKDITAKKEREQDRSKAIRERLKNDQEIIRALGPAMSRLSDSTFDLDMAIFSASTRALRQSSGTFGGPPGPMTPPPGPAPQGGLPRQTLSAPRSGDAFEMARQTRMRQLIEKHGSNRVAMVRIVGLPLAANKAKLYTDVRAISKFQDASMVTSPNELTVFLAPVIDLQVVAKRISFGKVTRVDPDTRTITVSGGETK
jgi:hypothetical protein